MAKRLIDAEALWRRLETEPWYNNADRDEVALPLVDDAPTVDAVEVVRCRDCYWNDGDRRCMNPKCTKSWYGCVVPNDHFCSYGERKEG